MPPKYPLVSGAVTSHARSGQFVSDCERIGTRLVPIGDGGIAVKVVIHRSDRSHLRPLVVVGSVDFPMPPSYEFCERMWASGYQVIFVERPGFGTTRGFPEVLLQEPYIRTGATVTTEAALLCMLLNQLELKDMVLLGMGSGNPVCYRLAKLHREITLSIFSNAVFNQRIWGVFRPNWFQAMLRQTLGSKPGLHLAVQGVKYKLRSNPLAFYRQILQKSPGDLNYFERNKPDFLCAGRLIRNISAPTFYYDLKMSLSPDELLHDHFFSEINAVTFSGRETTTLWQSQLEGEAKRLDLPVVYAERGDLYAPYASPDKLLRTIRLYGAKHKRRSAGSK